MTESNPTEQDHWISRYLDGELSAEQFGALQSWLREDDSHVDLFVERVIDHNRIAELTQAERFLPLVGEGEAIWSTDDSDEVLPRPRAASGETEGPRDSGGDSLGDKDPLPDFLRLMDQLAGLEAQADIAGPIDITKRLEEDARRTPRHKTSKPYRGDTGPRLVIVPRLLVYGGIAAAVLLIASVLVSHFASRDTRPTTGPIAEEQIPAERGPSSVPSNDADTADAAALTGQFNLVWADDTPAGPRTSWGNGERLDLVSGVAELTLKRGAVVVIEGPCSVMIQDDNAIELTHGKLVADVPPSAHLFAVHTPTAHIIDYGTQFGVEVAANGATDALVFKGEIELRELSATIDEPARSVRLTAGWSSNVDARGMLGHRPQQVSLLDQARFAHSVEEAQAEGFAYGREVLAGRPLLYWRFESDSKTVRNETGDSRWAGSVVGQTALGRGVFGDAIVLTGDENTAGGVTSVEKIDLNAADAFTFEAWCYAESRHRGVVVDIAGMNPDADWLLPHLAVVELIGEEVAATNTPAFAQQSIRMIHRNPPSADGFAGQNASTSEKYPVGRWMHLIAMKDGGKLKIYLDGDLVAEQEDPQVISSQRSLYCYVGVSAAVLFAERPEIKNKNQLRPFHGRIDEVAIYPRALTETEIRRHVELGREGVQAFE